MTIVTILLVPHQGSVGQMMLSRIMEVAWGVAVAPGFAWIGQRSKG